MVQCERYCGVIPSVRYLQDSQSLLEPWLRIRQVALRLKNRGIAIQSSSDLDMLWTINCLENFERPFELFASTDQVALLHESDAEMTERDAHRLMARTVHALEYCQRALVALA